MGPAPVDACLTCYRMVALEGSPACGHSPHFMPVIFRKLNP